jgi:hypothetical protein
VRSSSSLGTLSVKLLRDNQHEAAAGLAVAADAGHRVRARRSDGVTLE